MKQTALEWFYSQLIEYPLGDWEYFLKQAKAMEKEQIIDAYNNGQQIPPFEYAEQYYNKTFKSK